MALSQTIGLLIVTTQLLSIDAQVIKRHGVTEHCQWETFNATCRSNEVILMISAFYGRMHIGRCVPFDYFLGCSTDVLEQMENRCSGRDSCLVNIPDAELFKVHPCRKDLVAYLEASYRCVPVSGIPPAMRDPPSSDLCTSDIPLAQTSGYLAGSVTHRTGLGSRRCPWVVQVPAGQRINVTLYDFSSKDAAVARQPFDDAAVPMAASAAAAAATAPANPDCSPLAIFRETAVGAPQWDRQLKLCPGDPERRRVVYSSRTNRLNIIIPTENADQPFANMMLYFESVGCPDPEISVNAMLTRKEETLAIFCNQTGERWHLVCKENQWIGTYNNCSRSVPAPVFEDNAMKLNRGFPIGLLVAIAVGVIAGVVLGFLLLVMIFTCKKRFCRRRAEQSVLLIDYENQQNAYKLMDLKSPLPLQQGCECVLAEFRSAAASDSFDPSDPMIVHSPEVYFSEELLRNTLNKYPASSAAAAAVTSASAATSARGRQAADCTCGDIYRHTGTLCCDAWSPGGYLPEDYNVVGSFSPLKTSTTARLL